MKSQPADHAVLLTDDEVVALACARSAAWPGGLPTVDHEDPEQLRSAAFRGDRSLLVRRLRRPDSPDSEAETLADAAIESTRRFTAYLGTAAFARATWGLASSHYGDGAAWVLETISPVGIHRLGWRPVDEHLAYLAALLAGVFESGPGPGPSDDAPAPEGGPEWFCVLCETGSATTLVAARRGEVLSGPVETVDGTPRPAGVLAPVDLATAVTQLRHCTEHAADSGE